MHGSKPRWGLGTLGYNCTSTKSPLLLEKASPPLQPYWVRLKSLPVSIQQPWITSQIDLYELCHSRAALASAIRPRLSILCKAKSTTRKCDFALRPGEFGEVNLGRLRTYMKHEKSDAIYCPRHYIPRCHDSQQSYFIRNSKERSESSIAQNGRLLDFWSRCSEILDYVLDYNLFSGGIMGCLLEVLSLLKPSTGCIRYSRLVSSG